MTNSKYTLVPVGRSCVFSLLDYRGFLDRRYRVLALGAWIAQIGLWIPTYYIGRFRSFLILEANAIAESYRSNIYGKDVSFLSSTELGWSEL
jgi:hypothetical protein